MACLSTRERGERINRYFHGITTETSVDDRSKPTRIKISLNETCRRTRSISNRYSINITLINDGSGKEPVTTEPHIRLVGTHATSLLEGKSIKLRNTFINFKVVRFGP